MIANRVVRKGFAFTAILLFLPRRLITGSSLTSYFNGLLRLRPYSYVHNITYTRANGQDLKLDLILIDRATSLGRRCCLFMAAAGSTAARTI